MCHLNAAGGWRKLQVISLYPYSFFITCVTGAVSALAKFGAQNEEMLPSILVLLKRWASLNLSGTGRSLFEDPGQSEDASSYN